MLARFVRPVCRVDSKRVRPKLADLDDFFVLPHVQRKHSCHLSVVLQRLIARGLFALRDERHTSDFEEFRGREEDHLHGKMQDRVGDASLFENEILHAVFVRLDSGGKARRPCANNNDVERFLAHYTSR